MEFAQSDSFKFAVGLLHLSGHTVDGILDTDLIAPNLGDNMITIRGIYDQRFFRLGGTLKLQIETDPAAKFFAADQFLEIFPIGMADTTPYLAFGLEEDGVHSIGASFHSQLGLLWGNHTQYEKTSSLRIVMGFYTGKDLRLKYAQFKGASMTFFYGGIQANL
jgi:hypothetical protein